ncbi:MAG: type II toxin-antitoxin system VapC family toxin [Alphaproteobacteria bacterium]|nr:type II toxin-antitoxin system VapC family toxin [Alphaproteobacteria bacterium]
MIVLDTSAVMAILLGEGEAANFRNRIEAAGGAMLSAATAVEIAAVSSRDDALFSAAQAFLNEPFVEVEAMDAKQAAIAGDAYRRYGNGRRPAGLNLGDVFAYALARERELPLLFKGADFTRTDIEPA